MGGLDDFDDVAQPTLAFDLTALAGEARPREVTGATFTYVDALLAGRMSHDELARIKADILGAGGCEPAAVDPIVHVQGLMGARDYAAALHAAEEILASDPHHAAATQLAEQCRGRLGDLYLANMGAGHDVPRLAISLEALGQLGIDRWAAFLISRLEDDCSIDELVDLGGFTRLDTLRVLYELVQRGIVAIDHRAPPPCAPPSAVLARVQLKRSR